MGKLIVIVGGTGSGKTTLSKRLVEGDRNVAVFDVNDEYENRYNPFFVADFEQAIEKISRLRNTTVIVEEATNFFKTSSRAAKKFGECVVGKRHQNNNFMLLFHTLAAVPDGIFSMCDIFIVLKTKDNVNTVRSKYRGNDDIIDAYFKMRESDNKHEYCIIER